MLRAGQLFQEFSITSCLDDLGEPPEDYAIPGLGIKPFGLACLLLMAYGYACLKYYQCWVSAAARKQLEEEGNPNPNPNPNQEGVSRAVPGLAGAEADPEAVPEAELSSVSVAKPPPARPPTGDHGHAEGSETGSIGAPAGPLVGPGAVVAPMGDQGHAEGRPSEAGTVVA